jgi:hypothetical protein
LKRQFVPGCQWGSIEPFSHYDYMVPVRRSHSFFHCLEAAHHLEWPDQVKWRESRIQHKGDGFVAHRITSGSGWSTSKLNI